MDNYFWVTTRTIKPPMGSGLPQEPPLNSR